MTLRTQRIFVVLYVLASLAWFGRGLQPEYAGIAIIFGPIAALAWGLEAVWLYVAGTLGILVCVAAAKKSERSRGELLMFAAVIWLCCGTCASGPAI